MNPKIKVTRLLSERQNTLSYVFWHLTLCYLSIHYVKGGGRGGGGDDYDNDTIETTIWEGGRGRREVERR